jgi:hypothetical protein
MFWDKAIDADVDLWVQAPGECRSATRTNPA